MCGIHGVINTNVPEINSDEFIKSGFIAGMLRGVDSSGVAVIDTKEQLFDLRKLPISGNLFVEDKHFRSLLPDIRSKNTISIAHTRAATVGKVAEYTTHPFNFYDQETGREMVGVHNGTLTGWASRQGANKYDVDSNWALATIFEKGLEAFKSFTGSYCFVWWDSDKPGVLNIARNNDRPMHVAFTKKGSMLFASEPGMIYWLADRHSIVLDGEVKSLRPGLLYSFDLENLSDPKTEELPKVSYPVTSYNYRGTTPVDSRSIVQRVQDFLDEVMKDDKKLEVVAKNTKPTMVSKEEINDAKLLEILHKKVKFRPTHTDNKTDNLYGIVTLSEGSSAWEETAIIRHAGNVKWEEGEEMEVTVLGAWFNSEEVTVFVSKPRVNLAVVGKTAEAADTSVAH